MIFIRLGQLQGRKTSMRTLLQPTFKIQRPGESSLYLGTLTRKYISVHSLYILKMDAQNAQILGLAVYNTVRFLCKTFEI